MKRSKKEVLDADFAAARAGVLDIAAFLDRVDRAMYQKKKQKKAVQL